MNESMKLKIETKGPDRLPLIVQAYYPNIAQGTKSKLFYDVTEGKINIDLTKDLNFLIGVDVTKYERNEEADQVGFQFYKLKA